MLALPAPLRSPESPLQEKINGSTYAVTDGYFALADAGMVRFMSGEDRPGGAKGSFPDLCGECLHPYLSG